MNHFAVLDHLASSLGDDNAEPDLHTTVDTCKNIIF